MTRGNWIAPSITFTEETEQRMADRHAGYIVTLQQDISYEDSMAVLVALRQIKGVLDVSPVSGNVETKIAQARAERRIEERLWKVFHGE